MHHSTRTGRPPILLRDGERYGRLTVLERVANHHNRPAWSCRCDCGAVIVARGVQINAGAIKSCGCLKAVRARHMMIARHAARRSAKQQDPHATLEAIYKNPALPLAQRIHAAKIAIDYEMVALAPLDNEIDAE